jgi:hypothetical protein
VKRLREASIGTPCVDIHIKGCLARPPAFWSQPSQLPGRLAFRLSCAKLSAHPRPRCAAPWRVLSLSGSPRWW